MARDADVALRVEIRVGAVSLVVLVAALVRGWPRVVPLPLLALGGMYVGQLAADDAALDPAAAAVAAGLLVTAELAYWSLDERERIRAEPGTGARRLAYVAALGASAALVGLVLLTVADAVRARGLAIDLLGAVAAGAAVIGVWLLASRRAARAAD